MNKKDRINHARKFNSIMPVVNHAWAAKVLNMQVNPHNGPDLVSDEKQIEIKFCLTPASRNYVKWTVLEYQMNYQNKSPDKPCFWGLGTYKLSGPVSEIKTREPNELEELVISRELFIVNWDWMNQFTSYHNKGQTKISSWDHSLRHPKANKLPKIIKQHKVEKGIIYLTQNIDEEYFNIQ